MQLKETCLKTYAHLMTQPENHPITNTIHHTVKTQVKMHQTSLHHLAKSSKFNPDEMEKIKPTVHDHPLATCI